MQYMIEIFNAQFCIFKSKSKFKIKFKIIFQRYKRVTQKKIY